MTHLSPRLQAVVDALDLRPGMRVVEIGGAPGAAAREVARRVAPDGHVLVVDRSAKGIAQVERLAAQEISTGLLSVRLASAETVTLEPGERPYDLAFACRVGVLDGRHPAQYGTAVDHIFAMLNPSAPLLIDTGDPLRAITRPTC